MGTKILGLDLGTNSIGWTLRETNSSLENQIIDYGVTVFRKGVGDGKSGEFSLAAERRKNRSKRRLYNAKRYRKWELLKVLIENGMCPLTQEELRLWSIGDWQNVKNKGRQYPLNNDEWKKWLAMEPTYFGDKGLSDNGRKIRKSPYDLRFELIECFEKNEQMRKYKIGRALYHLVQRRGFKTSRKSGNSKFAKNEEIEKIKTQNPDFQIATLAKEKLEKGERFRASGVIQRKYFEDEFNELCKKQNIGTNLINNLYRAIYFVRPLRTQKGLVGKCTLEKGKPRIPISHPAFEEFRVLSFINNIQWKESGSKKSFEPIPMILKKDILENLVFKKITRGDKKGKISTESYFKFDEIIKRYSENGKYEFNYKNKPNVPTCTFIAGLMNVFNDKWNDKFIQNENQYGINWDGLSLEYSVKYGKKKGEKRELGYEEIWHLLYDYIQTNEKEEELKQFCHEVIGWTEEKTNEFTDINIPQGYGSLSKNAIVKILPYLQEGYIYTDAVSFANISNVLGKENFLPNKESVKKYISAVIEKIDKEKEKLNIVNGLIQNYFVNIETIKAKRLDDKIKTEAHVEVESKLKSFWGEDNWNPKSNGEQKEYYDFVLEKYQSFLNSTQKQTEKASSSKGKNPEKDYFKLPRLDEAIKQVLINNFSANENRLKHLYHPSDIDIYPKAYSKRIIDKSTGEIKEMSQLGDPLPPSKGFKNPMAMRTMHELKKLVNYLLKIEKIDCDTKIIIEIARELNDANKRWAIQAYQRRREDENIEFAKAIIGVAKEKYPNLNENDVDNIHKIRLWLEQLENGEQIYKQVKALKEDVQKYRLWKEQRCQCIYTGKVFNLTDLFDGTKTQFAHTFPRSDSFDNSLSNLTISDAYYNMNIQKNRIPTQLENYKNDWKDPVSGYLYTAIEPRLKNWIDKRDSLKERIEKNKVETKNAIRRGDIERKNELIKFRRLNELEFEYWDKKITTFTCNAIPKWWKNSQLIDTQIITKYARAYMKSLFNRVEVQKAGVISEFKKIYQLKGDEQKDRSRHSHHAVDAAVLTLIPGSAKREEILKQYYSALERNSKFHTKPYPDFVISHINSIDENVLINHVNRDRTLVPTFKKVRKRGGVQFIKDQNGNKIPLVMQGESIRGQLHKETFFGAIKVPDRNEDGFAIKNDGKYLVKKNEKTGEDEIWIVARKLIKDVDFKSDKIVDEVLKNYIEDQLRNGTIKELKEATDFQGKRIRHIRCAFKAGRGFLTPEKAIELKKHSHMPKQEHKKYVLVQNSQDGNYLYLLYEKIDNHKISREAKIFSLFDFSQNGIKKVNEIWADKGLNKTEEEIPLKYILKVGQKAIFYNKNKEELRDINKQDLIKRVFVIYKFNESGTPDIYLKNNLDARPNPMIDKLCENSFIPNKYQAGLSLKVAKLNCIFEGKDFEIKPDGEITFK